MLNVHYFIAIKLIDYNVECYGSDERTITNHLTSHWAAGRRAGERYLMLNTNMKMYHHQHLQCKGFYCLQMEAG